MSNEKNTIENDEARDAILSSPEVGQRDDIKDDSAFLSGLNLRMKNADWSRYERGSEAFFDIDHDLERLAKESPEKAVELWDENAPRGMRKPFYMEAGKDGPEKGAAPGDDELTAKTKTAKQSKEAEYEVPAALKKKYHAIENNFYFREGDNKLAFKDRGPNLVTEHNDPDVARSMIDLAEAKGWSKITVKGHEDFKREVWLQASLKGLEVAGYEPKEVDLAKLSERQKARPKNMIEKGVERDVKTTGFRKKTVTTKEAELQPEASEKQSKAAAINADKDQDKPGVISGKLLEHGKAPYDFNEKNEPSYYVKVETPNGTKMHWGVDLSRAVDDAKVKVGEQVELERLGKQPVVVPEKQYDNAGAYTGTKDIETERVVWNVKGEAAIAAERERANNPKMPELTGDYKVAATVMADVLRDKGYSAKTVDKALVEAAKRLDGMSKAGTPAPGVKMFDKDAPREVVREKMQVKGKSKDVERVIGGR